LASFIEDLKPYLPDWRSIELKVVAEVTKDGQLIFNAIRAIMSEATVGQSTRGDLPQVPGLFVCHERWEVSRLDELLESLSRGELKLRGGSKIVKIAQFNGQNWTPLNFPPQIDFRTRRQCISLYGVDSASFTLETLNSLSGAVPVEHWNTIDPLLVASDPPWRGLAELRGKFVGLEENVAIQRDAGRIQVIAPLNVRLGRSELEGDEIHARVEKTRLTSNEELRISVIATKSDQTVLRKRYSLRSAVESPLQDALEINLSLANKPSRVALFLSYRGIGVDEEELFGNSPENPRMVIFSYVGVEKLDSLLKGQGDSFEKGVAILFHVLGLNVAHYGSLPGEIPDIIAISKGGKWVLIVECTGGELDKGDKLSKLVTRSKEIAVLLPDYQVHPVIATSLSRKMIARSDVEKAGRDNIVVVTHDDLLDLLQEAFEGISEDEILRRLLRLVPPSVSGPYGLGQYT